MTSSGIAKECLVDRWVPLEHAEARRGQRGGSLLGRNCAQTRGDVARVGAAELRLVLLRLLVSIDGIEGLATAALDDRLLKDSIRARRCEQRADADAPGRLAEDGHPRRIAPEGGGVVADPGQGSNLIEQAEVRVGAVGVREVGVREEAERAQTVLNGDDDRRSGRGQVLPVVEQLPIPLVRSRPAHEVPSVHVDHHGQRRG